MINVLDIRVAAYVDSVRETKSISAVAKKFGIQYQTISIAIGKLEKKLGITNLFIKSDIGTLEPNTVHDEIFSICQQIMILDKKALNISNQNNNFSTISLYATQTLQESFFAPLYGDWECEKTKTVLNLKEDDGFNITAPMFNEVVLVNNILDDQETYNYFPFHNFRQKLWASRKYIEDNGPFDTVKDLDKKTIFLQKIAYLKPSNETKELIGFRGIVEKITSDSDVNINFLSVDGIRTVDVLCSFGYGIMAASGDPLSIMKRGLVNILPEFYGDTISIYVKVRKESISTSESMKNLVEYIFKCRDVQLESIGIKGKAPAPNLQKIKN